MIPIKASIKTSKLELQNEVAALLVQEGATDHPVDFRDFDNPLRIEIEVLLKRVLVDTSPDGKKKAKRKGRNLDRVATVKAYLAENYPGNKRLRDLILGDLSSYQGWEKELDDA